MATTLDQINVGAAPNDDTGDKIRDGGIKINNNTTKIGNLLNKIDEGLIQIYKYPGNNSISSTEQKDIVTGIIDSLGIKYFIRAQYNTGLVTDFGTAANDFNDGSYNTLDYQQID